MPRVLVLPVVAVAGWWAGRHVASRTVRAYEASTAAARVAGPLKVRAVGDGGPVVLLLHGMLSTGASFGRAWDALADEAVVVAPDLLGFGSSMDARGGRTADDHVSALDAALSGLGLDHRPVVAVGHSMGGQVALRWAAAQPPGRCRGVVTFGAPLYRSGQEAEAGVRRMGALEAFLSGDGPWPRRVCDWMCEHRTTASWLAVAARPDLPVDVARAGVRHTWASYVGAMEAFVRGRAWEDDLTRLDEEGVPVLLVEGDADPVPAPGRSRELAARHSTVSVRTWEGGDHGLPLQQPAACAGLVRPLLGEAGGS